MNGGSAVEQRDWLTRVLSDNPIASGELKARMKLDEVEALEALERSVATGVRQNRVLASKRPAELIKRLHDSLPLGWFPMNR